MGKAKGKPRGKPFVSDDPRSGPRFGDEKAEEAPVPGREGSKDQLSAMRAVLSQPASSDQGQWEKGCRDWYKRNPGGFMAEYSRLTSKPVADGKCPHCGMRADEPVEEDEGSKRALEVCEGLLRKFAAEANKGPEGRLRELVQDLIEFVQGAALVCPEELIARARGEFALKGQL